MNYGVLFDGVLLYFCDAYDINLWENTFGRRTAYSFMQSKYLYRISSFYGKKKRIDEAEDQTTSMRIYGFSLTERVS